MTKSLVAVAAAAALLAISPVQAAKPNSAAAVCTNDGIAKADAAVMAMPEGDNKTKAMQEMTSAKSSMTQQDAKGCASHMNAAMKMTKMKPKKM